MPGYSWLTPVEEHLAFGALDPTLQEDLKTFRSRTRAKALYPRDGARTKIGFEALGLPEGTVTLDPLAARALERVAEGRNEAGRAFVARAIVARRQ